jgi:hypothetical protein
MSLKYIVAEQLSVFSEPEGDFVAIPPGTELEVAEYSQGIYQITGSLYKPKEIRGAIFAKPGPNLPMFYIELMYETGHADSFYTNLTEYLRLAYCHDTNMKYINYGVLDGTKICSLHISLGKVAKFTAYQLTDDLELKYIAEQIKQSVKKYGIIQRRYKEEDLDKDK